jgi:hypothetical protein
MTDIDIFMLTYIHMCLQNVNKSFLLPAFWLDISLSCSFNTIPPKWFPTHDCYQFWYLYCCISLAKNRSVLLQWFFFYSATVILRENLVFSSQPRNIQLKLIRVFTGIFNNGKKGHINFYWCVIIWSVVEVVTS